MSTFTIRYAGKDIRVEQDSDNSFIVNLPDGLLFLIRKQDNEGASHWFEEGADNETDIVREIGITIESHQMSDEDVPRNR
ncbi:hypothetical protein ACWKWU_00065 [Chitinophaga lutea]